MLLMNFLGAIVRLEHNLFVIKPHRQQCSTHYSDQGPNEKATKKGGPTKVKVQLEALKGWTHMPIPSADMSDLDDALLHVIAKQQDNGKSGISYVFHRTMTGEKAVIE